jgi:large subunit ribosomal protein L18
MQAQIDRRKVRRRIRYRIRKKISGTAARPRLTVFRSLKHIYAQAIDDVGGRTLAHASTRDAALRTSDEKTGTVDAAKKVGALLGEKLKSAGIETAVFDRGGFVFHGRIKALADAVRESGVKF